MVKDLSFAKFDESVEVATHLGVDPRKADQIVRGTVVLPHGTGKTVRVLAVAQGEKEKEAEDAGADYVGVDYLAQIQQGWLEFDVMVVTPDLMGKVGPLGRILGPRGLMPTPKAGTVTFDIGKAVQEIKAGKIEFRVDKTGNVHAPIGRVSFEVEKLEVEAGATVELDEVLLLSDDKLVAVGRPLVHGAKVVAEVLKHDKHRKVIIFKYKRRKRYRRKAGHRQAFTALRVKEIRLPDVAPAPTEAETAPAAE